MNDTDQDLYALRQALVAARDAERQAKDQEQRAKALLGGAGRKRLRAEEAIESWFRGTVDLKAR